MGYIVPVNATYIRPMPVVYSPYQQPVRQFAPNPMRPVIPVIYPANNPYVMQNIRPQVAPMPQQINNPAPVVMPVLAAVNKAIIQASQTKKAEQSQEILNVPPSELRVAGYKNNLRSDMINNHAKILAVILRIMNAQDKDGNDLIQDGEISGNFINAVGRLDEIKNTGFDTLHVLPLNPPGKTNSMGTAGSVYAPEDLLSLDPELVDENPPLEARKRIEEIYKQQTGKPLTKMDKNDPDVAFAQCKYFIDECHKRGIKLMLDLPSCVSVDFAKKHPELMAKGPDGFEKTPAGWQDIRMLQPFENEQTRALNKPLLDLHKRFVDMSIDLGFDGIRADVGRAKPVEFWNVLIKYSHLKDPEFAWLAESYTHEDASPQLNMPYDRPQELLEAGFDTYYGQYHNFASWTKANDLYSYVKQNIEMNNQIGQPKGLIGSFATHDDVSPMLYGGANWVMFTTILQSMLPQVSPYMPDGVQTGDRYIFKYDHAIVDKSETDCNECTVHTGRMDIFNKSRKPGGDHPEIANTVKAAFALRDNEYNKLSGTNALEMKDAQDVITKGSFIILPSNNPEIISFARHKDGKTLLFIGNRNVNKRVSGLIRIPGLKSSQKFNNLMPRYGQECKFQNNQDQTITVDMGASRACVFEIDDADIQSLSKEENIYQQKYL